MKTQREEVLLVNIIDSMLSNDESLRKILIDLLAQEYSKGK